MMVMRDAGRPRRAADRVAARALSYQCGSRQAVLLANENQPQIESQTSLPFPLFQLVARGDPPCGHDVRSLSAEPAERRSAALAEWQALASRGSNSKADLHLVETSSR
jgi:hypothetical protein